MKLEIVSYVKAHPKCRLREIGGGLHIWHIKLLDDVHALVDAGILITEIHNDPANMESYIMYSVREK